MQCTFKSGQRFIILLQNHSNRDFKKDAKILVIVHLVNDKISAKKLRNAYNIGEFTFKNTYYVGVGVF